ncbi:MAG TPA: hypothetical protein VN428_12905 [Bryobacteraceae bacterium]|nr:hypothetical protein [Bryobacteraceae bacterium]
MRLFLLLVAVASIAAAADRVKLVHFHDEPDSQLALRDIAFDGAGRGIAVGSIAKSGRSRPAALVTTDAGRTWSLARLPSEGEWLFMDRRAAWFGDGRSVWRSEDLGKQWKKVKGIDWVARVFFLDDKRGWAVGGHKGFWETSDGGDHWTKVAVGEEPKTSRDTTIYNWIAFADQQNGIVTGYSRPPRRTASQQRLPDWAAPEERPREWPGTNISFETHDAGKQWSFTTASLFGAITRVELTPSGRGLALIEFLNEFPFAAEVFSIDSQNSITRAFRRSDRSVTDVAMIGNTGWIVAVEPPGKLLRTPIPGKLKLLRSDDLKNWAEVDVDYRAVAARAAMAVEGGRLWIVTDTGMILTLASD